MSLPPAPSVARPFGAELRGELGELLRPPRDDLLTVVVNALLVCAGWLVLPEEAERALSALPDPPRLRRMLRARGAALACVIGPVPAVVCVGIAASDHDPSAGLAVALVLLVLPFGVTAIAPSLGIRWPYHPRPLAWRWAHRRPWGRTTRWAALVVAPYAVVPALALALLAPGILAGVAIGSRDAAGHLSGWGLAAGAGLTCLLAGAAFLLGPMLTTGLAARREPALSTYLADPDRG